MSKVTGQERLQQTSGKVGEGSPVFAFGKLDLLVDRVFPGILVDAEQGFEVGVATHQELLEVILHRSVKGGTEDQAGRDGGDGQAENVFEIPPKRAGLKRADRAEREMVKRLGWRSGWHLRECDHPLPPLPLPFRASITWLAVLMSRSSGRLTW